ncbi:amidohydrolase family protein [Azospirillum sp. B4]|uniref:amidohydrolase family protein n=1 Tax=Azospirillum sp. B4 TaxID=95605 RepID=UPI000346ACD2|nr:amidohydrolase family protein [Azospirillum sp. B4]
MLTPLGGFVLPGASSDQDPDWLAFLAALQGLVHASCCGAGAGGALAATPMVEPDLHRFARQGYAAWAAEVKPARPLLPMRPGRYRLPDVRLVEPGLPSRDHVDLIVADGRIAAITPTGIPEVGGKEAGGITPVIEALRGHTVAPALVDLHAHLPPHNMLNLTPLFLLLQLRHGVVRTRDAGDMDGTGTPEALRLVLSGALPGPQIHYAYCFITTGRARWANSLAYDDPEQAPEVVARLRRLGASWVKAYENLDVPRLRALVAAAEAAGLGVMGHVPTRLTMEAAALPDAQHLWGVPPPASLRRDHVVNRAIDWHAVTPRRLNAVVAACVRQGLALTPTLVAHAGLLRLADHATECTAADARMMPAFYRDIIWHPRHGLPAYRHIPAADFDLARRAFDMKLDLVGRLAEEGVSLRLGTDVQQPFVVPGAALHKEIALFERAGLSRADAWARASRDAASVLGVADAGTLGIGARADLLLAPASPLEPGWRPAQASAVVAGGALMLTADLDTAIAAEQARFETRFSRHTARWLVRFALRRVARNFVS